MKPFIKEHNRIRKIFVDGKPFFVAGIQFDFRNCCKIEDFDWLFPYVVKLGCNTLFFPLQWKVIEKEEGRLDFSILEHVIKRCKENNLKLSLLWFGTNQGGTFNPAPLWMKEDVNRFRRQKDKNNSLQDSFCLNNPYLANFEKSRFEETLKFLAENDKDLSTVILIQIQNELCISMSHSSKDNTSIHEIWQERCYCNECEKDFLKSNLSSWNYGLKTVTDYLNILLKNQKEIFPALTYLNWPVNPLRPGEDIDWFLDNCPYIDFVAPDYYGFSMSDFMFTLNFFKRKRNLLFIAEHSTESVGCADKNLYLAIGYGCTGFDPWALDCSFGWRAWKDKFSERPFVDRDGTLTETAQRLLRCQNSLMAVLRDVAIAQGSEDFLFYVADTPSRKIEEKRWNIHWIIHTGPQGKWIICRTENGNIAIAGDDAFIKAETIDEKNSLELILSLNGKSIKKGAAVEFALEDGMSFFLKLE